MTVDARDEAAAAKFLLDEYVGQFGDVGIHMADARQVVACLRGVAALAARLEAAETALREALAYLDCDERDAALVVLDNEGRAALAASRGEHG